LGHVPTLPLCSPSSTDLLQLINIGICGLIGSDDLLACFVSGCCLNWDGHYHAEALARHDEVNTSFDMLLNLGGFLYIGAVIPWSKFHDPAGTGITWPLLIALFALVLFLRRIPGLLLVYRLMPRTVKSWKEALFMGYFGPIGIGAVFYVEHTRHLLPHPPEGDPQENALYHAMIPVVYFLALASIIVHGLSIPLLNYVYKIRGVDPIMEDMAIRKRKSAHEPLPPNSVSHGDSILLYNRFHRPDT
jgi:NhaP-type Na+/H+ or K+/H+ antiporter